MQVSGYYSLLTATMYASGTLDPTVLLTGDEASPRYQSLHTLLKSFVTQCYTTPPEQLLQETQRRNPEQIIVLDVLDIPLLKMLTLLDELQPVPVIVFAQQRSELTMNDVIAAGVSAYVVGQFDQLRVHTVMQAAQARFVERQQLKAALSEAEAQLIAQEKITRAKYFLMKTKDMSEAQAHQWLQAQAMHRQQPLVSISEEILLHCGGAEE